MGSVENSDNKKIVKIKDIEDKKEYISFYILEGYKKKEKEDKKLFLSIALSDGLEKFYMNIFDNIDEVEDLLYNVKFVKVVFSSEIKNGKRFYSIKKSEKNKYMLRASTTEDGITLAHFGIVENAEDLKVDKNDEVIIKTEQNKGRVSKVEQNYEKLKFYVEQIKSEKLKKIAKNIISKYENAIKTAIKYVPVSTTYNYSETGGYLQMLVDGYNLIDAVIIVNPILNKDLLYFGWLITDLGEVMSYSKNGEVFDETIVEHLIGNIGAGLLLLKEELDNSEIEGKDKMYLYHFIVEGQKFGSPVTPAFEEANIIKEINSLLYSINLFNVESNKTFSNAIKNENLFK